MNLLSSFQITGPKGIKPVTANTQVLNLNSVKAYLDIAFKPSLQIGDVVAIGNYRFYIRQFPQAPNEFALTDPVNGFVGMFNRYWPIRQYYEAFALEGRVRITAKQAGAKWNLQADVEFPENALALPVLSGSGSSPDLADQQSEFAVFEKLSITESDSFLPAALRNWLEPIRVWQTPEDKGLYHSKPITFSGCEKPGHLIGIGGMEAGTKFGYRLNRQLGYTTGNFQVQTVGEAQPVIVIPAARKNEILIKHLPTQPFYAVWHLLPERYMQAGKPFLTCCLTHKGDFTAFGPDGAMVSIFKKATYTTGAITNDLLLEENVEEMALYYGPAVWVSQEEFSDLESFEINLSSSGNDFEEGMETTKWIPVPEPGNWESFLFLNANGFWESLFLMERNLAGERHYSSLWLDSRYFEFLKDASESSFWRIWTFNANQWVNIEIKAQTSLIFNTENTLACLDLKF